MINIKRFLSSILNGIFVIPIGCIIGSIFWLLVFIIGISLEFLHPFGLWFLPLAVIDVFAYFDFGSFISVITESETLIYILTPITIIVLSQILVETVIIGLTKHDFGGVFFKIRLVSTTDKPLKLWRILYRTTLKYLSIAFFCPILLFPLFNKQRLFFHEWASGVRKVEITADKTEPPSKDTVNIDNEEKKFYKEQSENQC